MTRPDHSYHDVQVLVSFQRPGVPVGVPVPRKPVDVATKSSTGHMANDGTLPVRTPRRARPSAHHPAQSRITYLGPGICTTFPPGIRPPRTGPLRAWRWPAVGLSPPDADWESSASAALPTLPPDRSGFHAHSYQGHPSSPVTRQSMVNSTSATRLAERVPTPPDGMPPAPEPLTANPHRTWALSRSEPVPSGSRGLHPVISC